MGFGRQVVFTYLLRILLIPLGVVNAVIVARWLGPVGQGVFAALGAFVAIAAMFGSLGLATATTRTAAADPSKTPALLANARLTGMVTGGLTLAVLVAARWLLPDEAFGRIAPWLVALAGLALPFSLTSSQFQAVLLGRGRIRAYNGIEASDRMALLAASLVLLVGLGLDVVALVAATTVWAMAKLVVHHGLLWPASTRARPDLGLLRRMGSVSSRAYLTSLLSFLILRSDVVLVNALLGSAPTGIYSVAVRLAEYVLVLPGAVGTLLFPRIAARDDTSSAGFTALVSRHTAIAITVSCGGLMVVGPWLVRWLFGEPYADGAVPLMILLPGVWCISMQSILSNDLAGRDYPRVLPAVWAVALVLNVSLNLWWIPLFGIVGAAAASSVAYAVSFAAITTYWLRRFPAVRPSGLFVIRLEELRAAPHRLRRALHLGRAVPPVSGA